MDELKQPMLFFSTGYFIHIGHAIDTVVHDHHAIKIAISFKDEIEAILSDGTIRHKGVVINSDITHKCRTGHNTFLLINLDPESRLGAGLSKTCLRYQRTAALPEAAVRTFLEQLKPCGVTVDVATPVVASQYTIN